MSGSLIVATLPTARPIAQSPVAEVAAGSVHQGSRTSVGVASPALPNPRTVVDPGLDRVVLEFFNPNGTLANTIPSQRQLEAYRIAALAGSQPQAGTRTAA